MDQPRTDTVAAIVAGRKPMGAWDATVRQIRDQTLDRMAGEYAKDCAANR